MKIANITDKYHAVYLFEDETDYDAKWDFFSKRCSQYGHPNQPQDVDAAFYFFEEDWTKLWSSKSRSFFKWKLAL